MLTKRGASSRSNSVRASSTGSPPTELARTAERLEELVGRFQVA
ncbi:MAG TPA: hypothetical protein VNO82_15900 [Solirubrobacteraceae bacterium]|nr:hypothetical protein [Solirubrobacteraceae bacterium]